MAIGGQTGATYEYMGGASASLDLANTDYTNLGFWKLVTTNAAPKGVLTSAAGHAQLYGAGLDAGNFH